MGADANGDDAMATRAGVDDFVADANTGIGVVIGRPLLSLTYLAVSAIPQTPFGWGAFHSGATQTLTWLKRLVVRTLVRIGAKVKCTL